MKIFPIISACIVVAVLFFAVLQRETLFEFAGRTGTVAPDETVEAAASPAAPAPPAAPEDRAGPAEAGVAVMARASEARSVENAVLLRGQTEAAREVVVRAETGGTVISDPLRKGAYVEADALLCRLNPGTRGATLAEAEARLAEARARVPESQARVAEAEARVREAEINQTAASQLSEGGFASVTRVANADAALRSAQAGLVSAQSGLESAQAGIETAQAAVDRARDDLSKLEIRAPFSGLLESDSAELGALLQPGDPCATVVQLDPIKLIGFVPETQLGLVSVGADATATLASGQQLAGTTTFLARSADTTTRTFRVEVRVPNPDWSVRDGQTAEIVITGGETRAHLLPASALTLDDRGRLGVRIIDADSRARFAPVEMIRDTVDGVWLKGLPDKVDVILVGQEYVTDGVRVRPSFEELGQ